MIRHAGAGKRGRCPSPGSSLTLLLACAVLLGLPAASYADDGKPVVKVGTEGTYPPFTYRDPDTNELTGFDIEVIKAVAKEAGWDVEFVEATFDSIFPALDAEPHRRHRQPGDDQPRAQGALPLRHAVHLLPRRHRHCRRTPTTSRRSTT